MIASRRGFNAIVQHVCQWGQRRVDRHRRAILLGVLTFGLLVLPVALPSMSWAQSTAQPTAQPIGWSPVVVDGHVLFQVRGSSVLTAPERAELISNALAQELTTSTPIEVKVVREDGYIVLRGYPNERNLLTVTEQDVTTGTTPYSQALIWRQQIETALRQGQAERSPPYVQQAMLFALGVLAGTIALQVGLHFLGRFGAWQLKRRLDQAPLSVQIWEKPIRLFWQLGMLGLEVGLWLAVTLYVTDLFPVARQWRYRLLDFLTARVINLGSTSYSALELLLLLGFTIGLWFGVSAITRLFKTYFLSRAGVNPRVQDLITILVQYVLTFLGVIVLLQIWGLDVSSLAILASVLGVGIGFGVQNITNNFISGLIITVERPIEVGDFINVGELVGTVEQIGARSTKIRTLDQVTIIVPNSRFLETEVVNWSHGDPVCRLHIPLGLAYGSDVEKVKSALLDAARRHPEVLLRPRPEVWFQGYGESALNFELFVWTGDPKRQFRVKSDLYYEIEASLRRYGLNVPFPQRDVNLRSPDLEKLLTLLLTRPTPESSFVNHAHVAVADNGKHPDSQTTQEPTLAEDSLLPEVDLAAIAAVLQTEAGIQVKDRHYRLNVYPACFTGAELVEWLVQQQDWTRDQAVQIGQDLLSQGWIQSVDESQTFQDGFVFYRFPEPDAAIEPGNIAGSESVVIPGHSSSLDH